jgi:glycosyltransferase involved in cell wall biosynthesis/LmbE family N-acetylglucosaminyl deacetylase
MLNDLSHLPYLAVELPQGPWLVISTHPNDETFGLGGAILLAVEQGIAVDVLFLTSGDKSGEESVAATIEREALDASHLLGVRGVSFWRLPDRLLLAYPSVIDRLVEAIALTGPACVFFPSPFEPHPDHRVGSVIAWEALRKTGFVAEPWSYEISLQGPMNKLLDISRVAVRKRDIMAIYAGWITHGNSADRIMGLNQARAWSLPLDVSHAEAFYTWPKENKPLNAMVLGLQVHRLGMDAIPEIAATVSVIIRTKNRPDALLEAIVSVSTQTYRDIELVVVNDGGVDVGDLVRVYSTGSIRKVVYEFLQPSRGRVGAANAGLDLATGEFLLFLDDDDYISPEHIAKLADALRINHAVVLAYTDCRMIGVDGDCMGAFEQEFNPYQLMFGNRFPIHAALFRRTAVETGACRFDPQFDVFEDWDFWLQLQTQGCFCHMPGVSATYTIGPHGSGVHDIASQRSVEYRKVRNKWRNKWPDNWLVDAFDAAEKASALEKKLEHQALSECQKISALEKKLEHQALSECQKVSALEKKLEHQTLSEFQKIAELEIELNIVRQKSIRMGRKTEKLLSELADHKRELVTAQGELVTAQNDLTAVLNSRAWRVTAGPRALVTWLRSTINPDAEEGVVAAKPDQIASHDDYASWVSKHDTLSASQRQSIVSNVLAMRRSPLISVLLPVYNAPVKFLKNAIESVCSQLYTHWELCIVDDSSTDCEVIAWLEHYAKLDHRIHVVFRTENGHISRASNTALEMAEGEFVAFLDQDDILPEYALYYVAKAIVEHPDAGIIYSDEDKLDEQENRIAPYFKPDWNYELFLGQNLISHLGVYRRSLLNAIEGFRVGFEGSQDHDLALRCVERLKPNQIVHIPRILYHWRIHSASTASGVDAKPYALTAGVQAVNEHLMRSYIGATAELIPQFSNYRIRFPIPAPEPCVSIIIPSRNRLDLIRPCVGSILAKTEYRNYEVMVVDNNTDNADVLQYLQTLEQGKRIRILRDNHPYNFSALNNAAVAKTDAEFVLLLNNDVVVISPDWLGEMVAVASRPGIGAVGARLWFPDDTLQHGGVLLGVDGVAAHAHSGLKREHPGYCGRASLMQSMSAVTAACLLVRRSIYLEVGGLDEQNLPVDFNDVDFCLKILKAGYRNIWTPFAELYHYESASRAANPPPTKIDRYQTESAFMMNKWGSLLQADPAYNPNLTLESTDFSPAWRPRLPPHGCYEKRHGS